MRSDRLQELAKLREDLAEKLSQTLGYYHTLGYSNSIWPIEASILIKEASFRHSEMLKGMDDLYAIGSRETEDQQSLLTRIIDASYSDWLEKAWVHKPEGKNKIIALIQYVVASHEGKVYLAQLPELLYLVCYQILILQGRSLTDLVWHIDQPHPNSIKIVSRQIPMIMQLIEETITVSSPSMRSSYLTYREKPKKVARHLDNLLGAGTADQIKLILDEAKGTDVTDTLPVMLWLRNYRPEGDRLMLEQCFMWDTKGNFSDITTSVPKEIFSCGVEGS